MKVSALQRHCLEDKLLGNQHNNPVLTYLGICPKNRVTVVWLKSPGKLDFCTRYYSIKPPLGM